MPSKFKSPYASSFTTGCKNGTPCSMVVWNISKRTNTPVNTIWNSLCKAGLCYRQKFNGMWVYWPSFPVKKTMKGCNMSQTNMWQCFIDWCMCCGWCTPTQMHNWCGNQKQFMSFCKHFFAKQFTGMGATSSRRTTTSRTRTTSAWNKPARHSSKRTTRRTTTRKTTSTPWNSVNGSSRNYKFPTLKSRPATRRYVRAA